MSNIKALLKLAADSMKNRTLDELLKNDADFQKRLEEEKEAFIAVRKLELTADQREETEYDYRVNSYIAGMIDAYEILKQFDLTKE